MGNDKRKSAELHINCFKKNKSNNNNKQVKKRKNGLKKILTSIKIKMYLEKVICRSKLDSRNEV